MQRVLLRDIAKAAGVSIVAVSLALRNHHSIGLATRQRIQSLARELGYRPDPMLRALAEYRRSSQAAHFQGSIAWLNFYPDPARLDRYLDFRLYRTGAEARAQELGYKLVVLTPAADKMSPDKLRRVLYQRGIQGLLLPPQPVEHAVLNFDFSNFSAVTFGFSLESPRLHLVTNRQFHASRLAAQTLWTYGYRRIGCLISHGVNERAEGAFLGGYQSAPAIFSNPEMPPPFLTGILGTREGRIFRQWLRRYRPDAIVTESHNQLKTQIAELGYRMPEDIAIATLTAAPSSPEFAGIDQNSYKIGQLAVETVVSMLYRNETGLPEIPYRLLVEGKWQDGPSAPDRRVEKKVSAKVT